MAHILLVEPDVVLCKLYESVLTAAGYTVATCCGAQDGIFCTDNRRPDVIILELQLVGHSGIEFLYELRSYREWQAIPVVVHSQVPPQEFSSSLLLLKQKLGVSDYLYKPQSSIASLTRSLRRTLAAQTLPAVPA